MLEVAEGGSLHAFQFLIGTLKTQLLPAVVPSGPAFQFLIGTLKTEACRIAETDRRRFQFLIGTLKTGPIAADIRAEVTVSIPHRYAKNSGR